jgi:hypothetical protein
MDIVDDYSLLIRPSAAGRDSVASLAIHVGSRGMDGIPLDDVIAALYAAAADVISVVSDSELGEGRLREVRRIASHLHGIDVVEESKDRITMRIVANPASMKVMDMLNVMHDLSARMLAELAATLAGGSAVPTPKLEELRKEVDRYYWFTARQLLLALRRPELREAMGIRSPDQVPGLRVIAGLLNKVGSAAAEAGGLLHGLIATEDDGAIHAARNLLTDHTRAALDLYGAAFRCWSMIDLASASTTYRASLGLKRRIAYAIPSMTEILSERGELASEAASYLVELVPIVMSSRAISAMAAERCAIDAPERCALTEK